MVCELQTHTKRNLTYVEKGEKQQVLDLIMIYTRKLSALA